MEVKAAQMVLCLPVLSAIQSPKLLNRKFQKSLKFVYCYLGVVTLVIAALGRLRQEDCFRVHVWPALALYGETHLKNQTSWV